MERHGPVTDGQDLEACEVLSFIPGRIRIRDPHWPEEDIATLVRRLEVHPHVRRVQRNLQGRSITIIFDHTTELAAILNTLPEAPPAGPAAEAAERRPAPWWWQLAAPALSLAAGVTGLVPLSPLVAVCALPIGRRAVRSLAGRRLNIDVLDATAVGLLLASGDITAAGVSVALIETGERIRTRASGRARRVLRGWMGADVRGVRVIREESEPRIPITDIVLHDHAVVYAGETIPVDGVVISGQGSIDNRTWTGEPTPVDVRRGSRVLAGSTVLDGRVVIDILATGDDTRAGRLAAALEDAIAASTQVSDVARRIADRFVAPVFLLAGVVFGVTGDLRRLISILIVDFGTGIRIAVPTAVLTTMIAGARSNILFRNGRAIEELAAIDTVVFDKTGTLTTGNPTVASVHCLEPWTSHQVLRLAAAAEGHLPHPIARALRRHARRLNLALPEPERVSYQQGGGVDAVVDGHRIMLGNRFLLEGAAVRLPALQRTDESTVLVAIDGAYAARIHIRDRLRADAEETVLGLRAVGIGHIWLATGDRHGPASVVASQLQVDGFTARMQPEDKVELVRTLRAQGRRVAVVGDGINDAAAMAEANVGVVVPRGADLARETADVVLGGEDLAVLIEARRMAQEAMGLVRQNIGLVAAPNAVALGAATAGMLSPLLATGVNNGSTVVAALNALRPLRRPRRLPRPVAAD